MVVVCQILIDPPSDGVHRAGDTVSGVVKYAMDQPTEFKEITLFFRGESWCSWTAASCGMTTMHLGIDKHLTLEKRLIDIVDKPRTLPAGPYEYRFNFTLPRNIPPTFYGLTGNVAYRVSLEIKRQNTFNLITRFIETDVLVNNYLDPTEPELPMMYGVTKRLLKSFAIGKLKMSLKAMIVNPYVRPGDKAELMLEIINDSLVRIKCVKAELISTTVYTASCGTTKTETEKITDCATEIANVPSSYTTNLNISVPIGEHQRVQYCKVINREYKILVTVKLPLPYCNVSTEVPILI